MSFLNALLQLCHSNTKLVHNTWLKMFPCIWKLLTDRQQAGLAGELGPFVCSGSHVIQKDCHPSAIHTFVEAMCQCVPTIPIRPCVLKVNLIKLC